MRPSRLAILAGMLGLGVVIVATGYEPERPKDGPLNRCSVIDGDTLDCDGERIRLLAIDAPELETGAGEPSKASLAAGLKMGPLQIHRFERDRYGRTVGDVEANGISLSCYQIVTGHALYWPRYDRNRRIAKDCGL